MEQSKELKRIVFAKKHNRLLVRAALFPAIIYLVAIIRELAEYYFRFSKDYKYIYSVMSTAGLFIQLGTLLAAIGFALDVLLSWKLINNRIVIVFSILLSLLPVGWIAINLIF